MSVDSSPVCCSFIVRLLLFSASTFVGSQPDIGLIE